MKNVLCIFYLFVFLLPNKAFSTVQAPDILIWGKDTLPILSNPLESHPSVDTLREELFGDQKKCWSTAYWRGYQAEWTLIDKELFLTNIYSPCYNDDSVKADLANLFPERYMNGKVKADWVSQKLRIEQGKIINYVMGYGSIFEHEIGLSFKNGVFMSIEEYDNSKSKKSIYTQNSDLLFQFIYSHINWEALPNSIEGSNKVYISFQANESGKIDNVDIKRANNVDLVREAVRVVKLIPEWDVYYKEGKFFRMWWTYPIVFSEENKKKYAK